MLEDCWASIECLEDILAGTDLVIIGLFAIWVGLLVLWLIVGVRVRNLKRSNTKKF
jgi:hypothetical protein